MCIFCARALLLVGNLIIYASPIMLAEVSRGQSSTNFFLKCFLADVALKKMNLLSKAPHKMRGFRYEIS